jgi:hypothetical protein
VLKDHLRIGGFLNTLAEAFVPLHDTKILFLAPVQQNAPVNRPVIFISLEEILWLYSMGDTEPLPEESETRQFEAVEVIIGSYQVEGSILKSPIAQLQNMLLVAKDAYMPVYKAKIRHVSKPWLGQFETDFIQVQRARMSVSQS